MLSNRPCELMLILANVHIIGSYIDCQDTEQIAQGLRGLSHMHEPIGNMAFVAKVSFFSPS